MHLRCTGELGRIKKKREALRLPYPARNRRHENSILEVLSFVNTEFYY